MRPFLILIFLCTTFAVGLFAQAPVLNSIVPAFGPAGSSITISGSGFNAVTTSNIVTFGNVNAKVTAASANSLTVVVPAGATYKNISVFNTANHLVGYSAAPFNVTFPSKNSIASIDFNDPVFLHSSAHDVSVSDVDGDGKLDIVITSKDVADIFKDNVIVLRNISTAGVPLSNASFAPGVTFEVSGYNAVTMQDIDGDGKPDMLLSNMFNDIADLFYVRKNTSTPGSISFDDALPITTGPFSNGGVVTDIDGDGLPDIIAGGGNNSKAVSVMRNLGSGTPFSFDAAVSFPVSAGVMEICSADLDGDGKPDVVTANEDGAISVLRNTAVKGAVSSDSFASNVNLGTIGQYLTGFTVGDLDGDGKPDLVLSNTLDTAICVLRNTSTPGNISFAPKVSFKISQPGGIMLNDIDGDGKPDVIVNIEAGPVIYRNTSVQGSFTTTSLTPATELTTGNSISTAVGDLDGDGKPDVITNAGTVVVIFQNNPHITAAPTITAFAPLKAVAGSTVTIKGADLSDASSVTFGGVAAASFKVASPNIITAVVGAGASGDVTVTTPLGHGTLSGFTLNTAPPVGPVITPLADTLRFGLSSAGTKNITLADVATVTNGSGVTTTISPAAFDCSTKGIQTIAVRATNSGAPATPAAVKFNRPTSVALDVTGNLFVLDADNFRIRKITPGGAVSTFAGNGSTTDAEGQGTSASFSTGYYSNLATDPFGNVYVTTSGTVRKIKPDGTTSTIAGYNGYIYYSATHSGPEQAAIFQTPAGITVSPDGSLFVVDFGSSRISKVTQSGIMTFFSDAYNYGPGITTDDAGNLYVPHNDFRDIRKISPSGEGTTINTFGGNPNVYLPSGIAVDHAGNIYITDVNCVAKIATDGRFTILAGQRDVAGFADGPGPDARFDNPAGICIDGAGNIYVADRNNDRIRKIDPGGLVTTLAGGSRGYADGDIGVAPASTAVLVNAKVSSNLAITNAFTDQTLPIDASAKVAIPDYVAITNVTSYCGTGDITITQSPAAGTLLNAGYSSVVRITAADTSGLSVSKSFNVTAAGTKTLPVNNFKISTTSVTCKGSANGSIGISTTQSLNYVATITGNGLNAPYPFTTSATINNLAAGTYHVCITVPGNSNYQQCYDLAISQPKDLALFSTINDADRTITLEMSGGTAYHIELNGQVYNTTNNSISLPLIDGNNSLAVTTDKLCQGIIQKLINISGKIDPYPVPFQNTLNLNLGNKMVNNVSVEIHNVADGKLVYSKKYGSCSGVLQMDVGNLENGVYALHLVTNNVEKIYKVIKK